LPIEVWRVQALEKAHRRDGFDCGDAALNEYLLHYVGQDTRRSLTRAFVLTRDGEPDVHGYYTLAATSVSREKFPERQALKLPQYPIPAVLLGRLAVARSVQGCGLGEHLLIDALKRVARASATIGVHAVLVDAKTEHASLFYRRFGFAPLPEQARTLFLPMATVLQLH
jgi:GNAT superfamily N-acetyltransferase